jgi:hypothetical protein
MKRIITKRKESSAVNQISTAYLYTNEEETFNLDKVDIKTVDIPKEQRIKKGRLYEIGVFLDPDVKRLEKRFGIV